MSRPSTFCPPRAYYLYLNIRGAAGTTDAKTLDEEKAAVRRLNRAAFDHVVYAPLGFQLYQAWRKNVTGIVPSPLAFFWGVSKTA